MSKVSAFSFIVVAHTINPSTCEIGAGRSLWGQPESQSCYRDKPCLKKKKVKNQSKTKQKQNKQNTNVQQNNLWLFEGVGILLMLLFLLRLEIHSIFYINHLSSVCFNLIIIKFNNIICRVKFLFCWNLTYIFCYS